MSARRSRMLVVVFVLQALLLVGIGALHGSRVESGTRVLLEVVPLDPLDLARGAYVELAYDIDVSVPASVADGDEVFVELRRPQAGARAWTAVRAVGDPNELADPDAFVRLRARDGRVDTTRIGSFYLDADGALELERALADGGLAVVVLAPDGTPLLEDVRG